MANTKISQLTALSTPTWWEELVYAYNNTNGKITLNTMKTFASADSQPTLVSWVNIKTINNTSILWSWNIDVSWGGGWGGWPTELSGDANIRELNEWTYTTTYELYYKSWNHLLHWWNEQNWKTYIIVTVNSNNERWFFYFDNDDSSWYSRWESWYWTSTSASSWFLYQLKSYTWFMDMHANAWWWWSFGSKNTFNITKYNLSWTVELTSNNWFYEWMDYSIIIPTQSNQYTITVDWTSITNPFNITLPTNTTKHAIMYFKAISDTVAEIVDCKIAA